MKQSFSFTVKLVSSSSSILAGSPISLDRLALALCDYG